MWPFGNKTLLDADTTAWHVDNFEWLLKVLPTENDFAKTRLILPRPGLFDSHGLKGDALAQSLFNQVKAYCGMADWPVELISEGAAPKRNRDLIQVPDRNLGFSGTFATDGNAAVITYDPALLDTPHDFITTMAHELAHYLLATVPDERACDDAHEEHLTDLTAVFLGFGVFLANSAFTFEQWRDEGLGASQGWSYKRSGYLSETELVFATALFLTLSGKDSAEAEASLKPHLAKQLRQAMKELSKSDLSALRVLTRSQ